jgi:hypothetical protein
MSEHLNEQSGVDEGEDRFHDVTHDVEGHKWRHGFADEALPEPGEGKRPHGLDEDEGPDVEGHRWVKGH